MKTKKEILAILAAHKAGLQTQFKVKRLALFGSYARDDAGPDSDIDILVEVDPSIGLQFVTLADRIEQLLGTKTDIVSSGAICPRHRAQIEQELIYV